MPAAETQVVRDDQQVLAFVVRHQGTREQVRAHLDDACTVLVAHGAIDGPVLHLDGPEHHRAVRQDGRRGATPTVRPRAASRSGGPAGNHGSSPFSRIDASLPATPASASGRTVQQVRSRLRLEPRADGSVVTDLHLDPVDTEAVRTHPRATTMSPTTAPVDGISRAPNSPSAESVTVVPVNDSTIP